MGGYLREIFTSIQGEGIRIGRRQTFIRFLGCNLSCNYCDTPETQKMDGPFLHKKVVYSNPVAVEQVIALIEEKEVSVTGGEPLLQIEFFEFLLQELKKKDICVYLDTNGTLPKLLARVIDLIDCVALDFKIPTATGRPKLWTEHEDCLSIAREKDVFVKMVINENVLPAEIDTACAIIKRVDENIPLIIQPVFDCIINSILEIQKKALEQLPNVRIIPQMHKYLGLI